VPIRPQSAGARVPVVRQIDAKLLVLGHETNLKIKSKRLKHAGRRLILCGRVPGYYSGVPIWNY
jgi:hypothetical protein